MTEPMRVPSGDGNGKGGQFAPNAAAESEAVLDQIYRDDEGSFHYPPQPSTYQGLLRFWSNVAIPEEVLARFQAAYTRNRNGRIQSSLAAWEKNNPCPMGAHSSQRVQDRKAAWATTREQHQQMLTAREPVLATTCVRPLVRLQKMQAYSAPLSKAERDKLATQQFSLPGGRLTGTIDELLGHFHAAEYASVLREGPAAADQELLAELRRTTAALENIRRGV